MSKHKKKKSNSHHLDKVAKAQHRNEHMRKVRKVLEAINCLHILPWLPDDNLERMYNRRIRTINVNIAEGDVMPAGKLKWIRRLISAMLKRTEIPLLPGGKTVDLDTFFTAGITVYLYSAGLRFEHYPKAAQVKEALMPYELETECKGEAYLHLRQIAFITSLMMTDLTKRIYWATVDLDGDDNQRIYAHFMKWHSAPAVKMHVKINNENHIVYRVGKPEYQDGIKWLQVYDLPDLFPGITTHKTLDVYIQAHALNRLAERLDCLTRERIMMDMFASFDEMQMQLSGNTQKLLIEYRTNNIRAGYLLATVEGKKLIIRTFLFITQSATPEGDALHKNAKLHRDAIAFLNFDRLSTFMTPEIQENKRLRCFFKEAGCQSLLELNKIFADKDITITKHPNTTLIEDYLGIDLTKEFIEEEEPGENEDENEEEYETGDEAESESENEEPALEAEPAGEADPNKIKEVVIKIHWTKRIILGIITYSLRIFDLLATQNVKSSIKPGVKNYTDPDEIVALDKDDKFSSSKLSPTGRFFGWVIVLTLMISFTIITLPYYLIKRLIKGKKSQANLMDYRQFAGGRKRNKGRK